MAKLGPEEREAQDALRARVAERIRELAKRRGIPISHLADRSKVSRAHLWAVLGGRRAPTTDVLARLALVLQVDPHQLIRPPRKPKAPK
ncbi:MAG: helix-turn-helix transcriptional regulator [Myxococcales bacterium]|nr:helix-turn-helix transcriptional regulator [Myxococcales bacterium]